MLRHVTVTIVNVTCKIHTPHGSFIIAIMPCHERACMCMRLTSITVNVDLDINIMCMITAIPLALLIFPQATWQTAPSSQTISLRVLLMQFINAAEVGVCGIRDYIIPPCRILSVFIHSNIVFIKSGIAIW